ncbi:NERD domain-containing protein [Halobacillus shinanisalinarum]|uniref:NERD domain-containing protein n=1 Tax=Halobacillus shinanisalinarum TaxID=2932258 RepID=A0ABY4H154_9BACI|nr:NERD domain-containing protein [Halobacillus shinanisalinarum]UOQ94180.1 NERD domain-containing protein [Halobacillus shinanisalinarum]
MAQLIKLQDYISRYETNMYQYPSKYIRLKQENWTKIKQLWEQGKLQQQGKKQESPLEEDKKDKRWLHFLRKKQVEGHAEDIEEETWTPRTMLELKQYFLDGLLPFQIKWATTTLQKKSFVDDSVYKDEILKLFLQRLPDTFLVMYHSVVEIKTVPVEASEIILIGPHEIEIISVLDMPDVTTIYPSSESSWQVEKKGVRSKMFSPMHGLKRTETFVKSVMQAYGLEFPFHKVVLAPSHSFDGPKAPYLTSYIDELSYSGWLEEKRKLNSPLKHNQLKIADLLVRHTKTIAVKRPEWEMDGASE